MAELLDPKRDVVFKLLFTREQELLRAMLEAILGEAITRLEVMNPAITGDLLDGKGVVLDIRVRLACGKRVDVEMQARSHKALAERVLYYGAQDYAEQLKQGQSFDALTPTVVVVWSVEPLFDDVEAFHSVFELRDTAGRVFSDHLSVHLLELSRLAGRFGDPVPDEGAVLRWGRFLVAQSPEELSKLAEEDPVVMGAAKEALERLSEDPEAVRLARERADAEHFYRMDLAASRREGVEEGRREGVEEGRREGVEEGALEMLRLLLVKRFGELPGVVEEHLATASIAELRRIQEAVLDGASLDEALAKKAL